MSDFAPPPPPPSDYMQPESLDDSAARNWAVLAHALGLVTTIFGFGLNWIAPLVIMLTKGKQSGFVREHARESLNFQISLLIYGLISAVLVLLIVGLFLLAALLIWAIVAPIIASVRASNGEIYRYKMIFRFVS